MKEIIREWVNQNIRGLDITSTITDDFFLKIENNPTLFREYRGFVATFGRRTVNQLIGLLIKTENNLENTGRELHPRSKLITTYSVH